MSYIPKPDAWAARLDNTRSQHANRPHSQGYPSRHGSTDPAFRSAGRSHRRQSSIVALSSDNEDSPSPPLATAAIDGRGRHRSASGSAPKAPPAFVEAGTVLQETDLQQKRAPSDTRPNSAWRKLELPKLQLTWPIGASRRRSTVSVVPQLEMRLWTPEETSLLAHASLRFWIGGRTADLGLVARDLRRSVKDVQTMLQLMLQEYVLHAQKTHWSDDEESMIRRWAAAEFPKCPTLNAAGAIRQSPPGMTSASNCFSLLRCRPSSGHRQSVVKALAQGAPTVVVDESELLSAPMGHPIERQAESNKQGDDKGRNVIPLSTRKQPLGPPSRQDPDPDAGRPLFSFTVPTKQDASSSGSKASAAEPKSANPDPAATATAASRKDVNILSKNTRSRRPHELRMRRASPHAAVAAAAAPARQAAPSVVPSSNHAAPVACNKHNLTTTRMSCDPNDAELSPEQSTDTHDFNRLDGDIDLRFFDVPAAARKVIRGFVDGYIERYFDVFFYRTTHSSSGGRGQCAVLEENASSNDVLTDFELLNTTEREMLCFQSAPAQTGISLDRCSLHFHASLLRAVQRVNIYASDANWPSADAYATAVYNRAIEDVHYLALEGRTGTVERNATLGPAAAQRTWFESVGLRMNQFKRLYYMGVIASRLTSKYVQGPGQHVFLERVKLFGYRAVPTATNYDDNLGEEEMARELEDATSDVSIRGELHSLIMDMVPHATNNSTMIAMQRSVEVYNKIVVEYIESRRGELARAFEDSVMPSAQPIDPSITEAIKGANGVMTTDSSCAVARWIAEQSFERLKAGTLKALVVDHQFQPVPLSDVRRWIAEGRSPTGKNAEYFLNIALYEYLKAQRVKMNETKWLYASAAATLRLIELVKAHIRKDILLAHIGLSEYAALFKEFIIAATPPVLRHQRIASLATVEQPLLLQAPPKILEAAMATLPGQSSGSSPDWSRIDYVGQELQVSRLHLEELAWSASSGPAPLRGLPAKDVGAYGQYKPQADAPQGMRFGYYDYPSTNISPMTEQSTPTRASEAAVLELIVPARAATEPTAEARLGALETEVASMRQEIRDVVKLQHNVGEILDILRGQAASLI